MTWLAENSLPIWMGGAVALTMAFIVYLQTRSNGALLAILGVILVTAGLLAFSYRMAFFSVDQPVKGKGGRVNLQVAMLLPVVALLLSTLLTTALSAGMDWLYCAISRTGKATSMC